MQEGKELQFTPVEFMLQQWIATIAHLPQKLAIKVLRLYRATLSPDHGPLRHLYPYGYCRHEPTCSQYAMDVIERRGFVVGSLLSLRRVLTCHPWRKPDDAKMRSLAKQVLHQQS